MSKRFPTIPGGWRLRAYTSWVNLRARCDNKRYPRYPRYGGRGIRYCERWRSFASFLEDMGERPEGMTLDRIDNNGDYTPSNCRWATQPEQQRNRSTNKLTQEKADAIRRRALAGEAPGGLAREYGVSQSLIYVIRDGRIWNACAKPGQSGKDQPRILRRRARDNPYSP